MTNSIFKEVTFTPSVFDKNIALESERKFEKLLNILEDIVDSGIIIGISRKWQIKVNDSINKYEDNERSELKEIFNRLGDRVRLVSYPISKDFGDNEDMWIYQAEQISKKRAFDIIVASKDTSSTKQIDSLDRRFFKNKGAKVGKQSRDFMNKMLSPILSYAEVVTIIDPYFSFNHKRFLDALEIICKNLANHHGIKDKGIIDIHTSIKAMKINGEFKWQEAYSWSKIIKGYENKYEHPITLTIWEEVKKKDEWHERWIITNQCGISMGKGSDISEWTDSTWSLLDWEELPDIANKFDKNRNIYNYISTITSSGIVKNQNPKNTTTFMTNFEKETKRKAYLAEVKKNEEEFNERETITMKSGIRKKVSKLFN